MRNDVWLYGGAGRGLKMGVVANESEDETKTAMKQNKMHTMYKTRQPELLRVVTVRSAHNTGAGMTWLGRRRRQRR